MISLIRSYLAPLDAWADYVPKVSTYTNLWNLFQKCLILPYTPKETIWNDPYLNHVDQKSACRCIAAAVPVWGNIACACYDFWYRQYNDKAFMLREVVRDGLRLQDDETIALAAVNQNGLALQYASERLRNNPTIVLAASQQNEEALAFLENHRLITLIRDAMLRMQLEAAQDRSFQQARRQPFSAA